MFPARLCLVLAGAALFAGAGSAAAQTPTVPGVQDVLSSATIAPGTPTTLPGSTPGALSLSPFGALLGTGVGPTFVKVLAPAQALTGEPTKFTVQASDPTAPIRGISFDFGEAQGRFGEFACHRHDQSRRAKFTVPYTFRQPGLHTITMEITSGGCSGLARATDATITLLVGQGTPRAAVRTATPDSAVATSNCRAADQIPTATTMAAARTATLCLLNVARRADGARRLRAHRRLRKLAIAHSADMVAKNYFDHTEPPDRTLFARLRAIHWAAAAGENILEVGGPVSPRAMMSAWLQSSGHRANILDRDFHFVGVGIVTGAPGSASGITATTDFGGR